jgi:aspartate/methionine/tyrosine aminotransferase
VSLVTYPLFEDFGWWIDFAELERKIGPRTRAVIVVHPNNPTGHATSRAEREELEAICVRHDLALIVDEVFLDYGLSGPVPSFASGTHPCPTFVVSGLSKIAALPQMKVGWIACLGPDGVRRDALSRLEVIADTFLSMNAPAQYALPFWLEGREEIQRQVLARVRTNLTTLAGSGLNFLPVEAGWSAIIRLPQNRGGSHVADRLVTEVGVAVHPGTFYGLPGSRSVVVSLIGGPEVFSRGIQNLKEWCEPGKLT